MSFTSDYLKRKNELEMEKKSVSFPSKLPTQSIQKTAPAATNQVAGSTSNGIVSTVVDRINQINNGISPEIKKAFRENEYASSSISAEPKTLPNVGRELAFARRARAGGDTIKKLQEQQNSYLQQQQRNDGRDFWDDFWWGIGYGSERIGAALLGGAESLSDFVGSTGSSALEFATSLGYTLPNPVSDFFKNQAETFLNTSPTNSYKQSIEERYKPNDAQRTLGNVIEGVAAMLPSLAASYLTGGGSALAQGGSLASGGASAFKLLPTGNNLGRAIMGVQAAGGGAQEAYQEGADLGQSLLYGTTAGLLETTIESLAGGIPGLGKGAATQLAEKMLSNPTMRKALDIIGEGGEEAISAYVTPYIKRQIYDPDAQNATPEEIIQNALMGMAVAGVLQGGIELPSALSTRSDVSRQATENLSNPDFVQRTTADAINQFNQNVNNRTAFVPDNPLAKMLPTVEDEQNRFLPGSPLYKRAGRKNVATEMDGPSESLVSTDNILRYRDTIDSVFTGALPTGSDIVLGKTPSILTEYGAPELDLHMKQSVARKIAYPSGYMGGKHNLGLSSLKNLPYQLADPIAIIENPQSNSRGLASKIVLTEWTDMDGKPVIVPIHLNAQGAIDVQNEVASAFGADYIRRIIGDNGENVLYTKNNEDIEQLLSKGRPVPQAMADDVLARNSIPSTFHDVNQQYSPENSIENGSVGGGSVGAMRSNYDYKQNTSRVGSNTFSKMYQDVLKDIEQNGGEISGLTYDVVTERQSMDHAQQRLFVDLDGEINDLPKIEEWGGEDLDTAMGILDRYMAEAMESGNYDKVNEWAKLIQSKGTKAGQMIQAFAKYSRTPQGVMVDAVRALENSKLNDQRKAEVLSSVQEQIVAFDSIPDGDTQSMVDLIKQNSAIRRTGSFFRNQTSKALNAALKSDSYDHLRDVALAQIDSIAKDYKPRTIGEKIRSARSMFMLSNITTVLRNFVGNQIFDPIDSFAGNTFMVPFDAFLSKFTGTRSVAAENPFSLTKWKGAIDNATKSYIEVALDVSTDGVQNRYDQTSNRTFKMTGGPLERFLSTWAKYQGYALNTTDEFAKGGVQAETQRRIDRLKERGLVADDTLDTRGKEQAKYRTFQDDTRLSRTMLQARDAANNIGVDNFGAGDLFMPYARVPANLVTRAFEYSPLGLANGTAELVGVLHKAHNGTLTAADQAKAVSDIGRGITGTGLIAAFGALAAAGLIRVAGGGEGEEDKTALETSEGISGTQINLSGALRWIAGEENALEWRYDDQLMSIGFLEPLNAQMTTGALLAQELDGTESTAEKVKTFFKSSFAGTLQSLLDLPAMSSLQDLVDGYSYSPAETTGGKVADALTSFAASQVSSFIPNIIRGVAKATDPYVRDAYSSGTTLGEIIDNIKMSIPGLRQTLPIKQTPFGQDRTYGENQVMNALNAIFLPGAITEYRTSDAAQELYGLPSVEDTPVYPRRNAPNSISYEKTDYALSSEQKTQYQKVYGQTYQNTIEALMQSGVYEKASGEDKTKMVNMAREYAGELAKQDFLKGQNVSYIPEGWIGGAIKNGIDPEKYLVYAFTADADGNNSVSQSEAASALLPMKNLSNAEKGKVWQSQNSSWNEKKNPFTGALVSAGITPETATNILKKYSELQNQEMNQGSYTKDQKQRNTELSKYLDGLGLSSSQREVVDNTYAFLASFDPGLNSYSVNTMSKAAQEKWPAAKQWGLSEEQYLTYYPIVSSSKEGVTKEMKLQQLQDAGMTYGQAKYFWDLVKSE